MLISPSEYIFMVQWRHCFHSIMILPKCLTWFCPILTRH